LSNALGTLENGALALGKVLQRMVRPLDSTDPASGLKAMIADLGWTLPDPVPPALIGLKDSITSLAQKTDDLARLVKALAGDAELLAAGAELLAAMVNAANTIGALPGALAAQLPPGFVAATNFPSLFAQRLFGTLIVDGLIESLPVESTIVRVLGLIEIADLPADAAHFQPAFKLRAIHWERLSMLLSDPVQIMHDAYGWGSSSINLKPLHDALFSLSFALGFPGVYDYPSPGLLKTIAPGVANPKPDRSFELTLFDFGPFKAKAALTTVPKASPGEIQGVAIALVTTGSLDKLQIPLSAGLTLGLTATFDASAGVAVILKPGQTPQLIANYDSSPAPVASGELSASIISERLDGEDPFRILSLPGGSRIEARQAHFSGGLTRAKNGNLDPKFEAGLKKGKFVLSTGNADGFLSKILPGDGVNVDFDLAVGWSNELGVYVEGTAGLSISIPLHVSLGPFSLEWLFLDAGVAGGSLGLRAAISGKGELGPLAASVDHIGLKAITTFPPKGGNLGPANIEFAFKPPNGIGLSMDAGVVKGGGFLYIDTEHGEYAGALELVFADFLSLSAVGLISTKMPDGSNGFSLLIIITADFGAGIQLGFGFTLLAVGGLLGLNRTMLFQPLMDGIRSDAIESIMFPKDVVANAMRIISDLRAIFPPREGIFLIGPMGKLGWGEPTLVSLALGVIIEIPGNVAILGVLKLALPADDVAVVKIQVNFAGAIEFDKSRLYFFASLYDSHVLFITIEGEMGVLFAFGDDANFVISVGGFHPQFNPPPLPFPSPRRIEVDIINESFARIRCDGYFAVTSNTAQFGSHSEFFFGFSALSVEGHSGFDALLQFSPFHFTVSISTSFCVKVFGLGVYGVGIDLLLEGPTKWHAHGTASLSFFFFSVDIGIDFTWGDERNTMLPPVAVMPILAGEFGKQSNWRAILPPGSNLLVSLRKLDSSEAAMVLHPVGTLHVSQRAVPLDLTLDKSGNQAPNDANRFVLTVSSPSLSAVRTLQEQFALAQFKNLGDAAKLSQQAFSPMDSGLELSAAGNVYASGTAITCNVRYDLTIIDTKLRRFSQRFYVLVGSLFNHFLFGSSVARSSLSAYRMAQTQPFAEKVAVNPESFAVAVAASNSVFHPKAAAFTSHAAAADYMSRAVAEDPTLEGTLHVIPQFEVAA
jgi:hypothetical protein